MPEQTIPQFVDSSVAASSSAQASLALPSSTIPPDPSNSVSPPRQPLPDQPAIPKDLNLPETFAATVESIKYSVDSIALLVSFPDACTLFVSCI